MIFFQRPATLTAAALVLAAQSAQAELSAADVWGDWRDYLTGFGYSVTGSEAASGDTLTVSDVTIAVPMPEGQGSFTMQMSDLTFTGQGDGTVAVGLPASMPMVIALVPKQGEKVDMTLDYTQSGFQMTASGEPTDIRYDYSAGQMAVTLAKLAVDGRMVPPADGSGNVTISGVTGTTTIAVGSLRAIEQQFEAAEMTYRINVADPENGGSFKMEGATQSLGFAGSGTVPLVALDSSNVSAMIDAGFGFDGAFTTAAGNSRVDADGPEGPLTATTSSQGSRVAVAMSAAGGLAYDVALTGLSVNAMAASAPLPIAFDVAQAAFKLAIPVKKSEEPGDFALGFALAGFSMSDAIWGIFDPTGQLPRDPATIALDLSGKARLLFDFLDPAAAAMSGNPNITPAQVESLDINRLQLSVAGAELTGTGNFTFDNSQGPQPRPDGAADLKLTGGNGLLDKLVAMGLLPEDQAMGTRMMMGVFGVPAAEPDTLTSRIEVKPDGQILANGQRIK